MSILNRLALWWKLKQFAARDAERIGSVRPRRPCLNCGKHIDPLTSWVSYGALCCGSECFMALRYPVARVGDLVSAGDINSPPPPKGVL